MDTQICHKCKAPIRTTAARCPLCGAEQSAPEQGTAFQPAVIGMRAKAPVQQQEFPVRKAVYTALAVAGGLLLIAVGISAYRIVRASAEPPPLPPLAPPAQPSGPIPLTLQGVPVPDPSRVDPTDMLNPVRKRFTEAGTELELVEISVIASTKGVVDLSAPEAHLVYRFLSRKTDPRAPKGKEVLEFALSESATPPTRSKGTDQDEPAADPRCPWSAAWRAAISSGLDAGEKYNARYARYPKSDKTYWVFTVMDRPEVKREVDGSTCAIRMSK